MPFPPAKPTPKTNWADDDEDDFDFDTWVATADTSTPTLSSLPPLQLSATEDEMSFTSTYSTSVDESAPWVNPSPLPSAHKLDIDLEIDWRCGKAMLAWRATQKAPGLPAYIEMSGWDNGIDSPWIRVQYSQHWRNWKVGMGMDCRQTAMFKGSALRGVEMVEEEVDFAPDQVEMDPALTITTDTDALKTLRFPDEGYYTDDSPLVSPTSCASEKGVGMAVSTSQIGLATARKFTRHRRVDSQDALKKIEKAEESEVDDRGMGEEGQEMALDVDDVDGGLLEDISMCLSDAAAKGWYYVSSQPWRTTGVITSSIVLGGSMYLLRKG